MALRNEKEIREEIRKLREKAKSLSGFWVSELAAAIYALEWVLGKREKPPPQDIGEPDSGHGKLAESISKAAEKAPPATKPARATKPAPKSAVRARPPKRR
ncbi:MAG TPA: hypothetical protein VK392_10705 [Thermoanaerobaculia bacterium]|nr:hypothetical protein [Thermoanaerobaculia bacterium]